MLKQTLDYLFKNSSALVFGTPTSKLSRLIPNFKGVPLSGEHEILLPAYREKLDSLYTIDKPYMRFYFGKDELTITIGCDFTASDYFEADVADDVSRVMNSFDSIESMADIWNSICKKFNIKGVPFLFESVDYHSYGDESPDGWYPCTEITLTYAKYNLV